MFFHQFKKFADLVGLGVLAVRLDWEWARYRWVDPDHVTALGPVVLKTERSQQFLEISEEDRGTVVSEKMGVELVNPGHSVLCKADKTTSGRR